MTARARCLALLALWLAAVLVTPGQAHGQQAGAGVTPAEPDVATAPVVFEGKTLFRVRGVSSLPAATRARIIRNQLAGVAADSGIDVSSLRLVEVGGATRILAGGTPITTIVEADASLEQVGRAELASAHLARLRQAILDYRSARSPAALWRATLNALAATLILAIGIGVSVWSWRRVNRYYDRRLKQRIQSVEIKSFELMRAERIWATVRGVLFAVRTLIMLAMVLLYLGFVLGQFPWTREISRDMAGFALRPLEVIGTGIVSSIPSLAFLAVLFFGVKLGLRVVRLFFDAVGLGRVTLEGFDREWAEPTYKLIRVAAIAFALVVAYPYIPGSNTEAFKGVTLFIGIVFSLGSSSAISNIIAGYLMTYRRALKVGDRVRVGDAIGDVIETRLQVTHIRSTKNEEIIVPNSKILNGDVINYSSLSRAHGLILHTEVGIGYETPWRQVEAMLIAAAERTEGISAQPRPFVYEKRLGEFAVFYELNAYCSRPQAMNQLYAALHRNILDVFNEFGVQIMTPTYDADPPEPKVVPRNEWYAPPAVRGAVEDAALTPPRTRSEATPSGTRR